MWAFIWWCLVVPLAVLWLCGGLCAFAAIIQCVRHLPQKTDVFDDTLQEIQALPTREDGC